MSVYLWTKRHLTHQKSLKTRSFWHFSLPNVLHATSACNFFNISTSKSDPTLLRFVPFDFVNISTSKSAPSMTCFDAFHFQTCFAPQRCALFRHLLSRHNGVQLSISHLASWLRTPPDSQNIGKTPCFGDFPTFSRTCIFSLLTFSISDLLPLRSSHFWLSPCPSFFLAVLFHRAYCQKFSFQTSFDKSCTKHVLLCTTKLAQSTSQYYFVFPSLHKAWPSTTVYYPGSTAQGGSGSFKIGNL